MADEKTITLQDTAVPEPVAPAAKSYAETRGATLAATKEAIKPGGSKPVGR